MGMVVKMSPMITMMPTSQVRLLARKITGVSREKVIQIAREFAENAHKTQGKSMVIIGAGMNHWYHLDMNYRGVINMLMLCGCIGKIRGGWAHYVGQEKLRPQSGWAPVAFGLDWHRPPRHMNSTSFFYNHSSQWRHETVSAHELLSHLMPINRNFQSICSITTLKLSGQVGCHLPPIKPKSTDHCPQAKSQRHECSRLCG